jgi:exodeoxyribonuclease VII small subunit
MEKNKSFEEAMSELEKIIEKLEVGELPLDDSLEYFQKGIKLSKYLSKKLDEVERKISVIIENSDGSTTEKEFSEV